MSYAHPIRARARRIPTGLLVLLGLAIMILGCMAGEDAGLEDGSDVGGNDSALMQAQAEFARHHVDRAQSIYNQIIAEHPNPPGQAYAGKAISDLLLLPGSPELSALLVAHLDATHMLDANALLYADEGLLFWAVRGVPWEDQGSYKGVRSLISARLPWPQERLAGVQAFFTGITHPLNLASADLVQLADAMASIQDDLARALADDYFDSIYIPGLTFHSEQLDIFLGRSELHLLSAMVSGVRAGLYFVSAYDFDFSLDEALGTQTIQRLDPQPDWDFSDYAYAFLDSRVLRAVEDPARLLQARDALDAALDSLILALRAGQNGAHQTTLRWADGDPAYADAVLDLLAALRRALVEPTPIPAANPPTTVDLSPFFEGGRVLDSSIDWFERKVDPDVIVQSQDEDGQWVDEEYVHWKVTEDAVEAFFLDGVFDPPLATLEDAPKLEALDGEAGAQYMDDIFGPFIDR